MTRLPLLPVLALVGAPAFAESHASAQTVAISNFAFQPDAVMVATGTTVTFANQDSAPHTATSTSGAFDTGRLSRGSTAALTFSAPGTYDYFCAVHPNMKGRIVVE